MNEAKSVALICFDNPFLKPVEGGKLGMLSRIKSLSLLEGYVVDVFLHNKLSEGFVENFSKITNINNIYQYGMKSGLKTLFGRYPICSNKRFVSECENKISEKEYDFVIYEGLQVARYRFSKKIKAKKHILYFHDIESEYRKQLSKSQKNPIKKLANILESKKFKSLEKNVNKNFDYFWFVSKDECQRFCKTMNISEEKTMYIPIPASNVSNNIASGNQKKTMLYVGDLTLDNNYNSLVWFVKNVFVNVKLNFKDAILKVVGSISESQKDELKSDGVEICGYVDDIEKIYDQSSFMVSPVLFGAGVKVKIIDALAHGQILVTTKKAIEGTNLNENYLIFSDDPNILTQKCLEILKDRQKFVYLSKNGLEYIKNNHTTQNQAKLINQSFETLLGEK